MTTHILAIDGDTIQAIVMVVVMVLMGLGGVLKKRSRKAGEGQGKTIIIPSLQSEEHQQPLAPHARPSAPTRPSTAPRQPMTPPQVRPTPVARQQPPQVRPTPIQRPTARTGEPARPGSVPRRPDRVARPRPLREPAPPRQSMPSREGGRQAHRVRAADHAATVAAHAEHVASRLKEERLRAAGELRPGEHAHGEPPRPSLSRHSLLSLLNPRDIKQAVILSEIIQPPLALRENDRPL